MADFQQPGQESVVQERMTFDEIDLMVVFLVRHPGLFAEARQVLVPGHFSGASESPWSYIWQALTGLYDRYGASLNPAILEVEALTLASSAAADLPASVLDEIRKFVAYAYDMPARYFADQCEAYGYSLLQKFLQERHWGDSIKAAIVQWGDDTPVDAPAFLADIQARFAAVQGVSAQVTEDLIPENWEQTTFEVVSTGLEFIDAPMGGGVSDGEVYGLLGTFGSGKTMMACQIAGEAAMRMYAASETNGQAPRQVIYLTYETPPDDIRKRVISNLAQIKLDHLNLATGESYATKFSRAGARLPYEEEMFGTSPLGEWERYQQIVPVSRLFGVSDMRGGPDNPKAGTGFVIEIQAEIDKRRRKTGKEIGLVIIDYAVICARRLIRAKGWDEEKKLRGLLGGFGDQVRSMVAQHFHCPVWILNQLSGESNKRAAGARNSHADSAEARNFAENLWYAFCIGNKDGNNMVSMDVSKSRRSEGQAHPTILHLRGDMARFVSADDRYMVDPNTRRIVQRSSGEVIAPAAAQRRRPTVNADFT